MSDIKLAALDLDGTLFDDYGKVTEGSKEAIRRATEAGVEVVISTGRPLSGIPFAQLEGLDLHYAITTNGAAVYRLSDRKCIYEQAMPDELSFPLLEYLLTMECHIAVFMNGDGISPDSSAAIVEKLVVPENIKNTYHKTRLHVPDLLEEIRRKNGHVQKITLNFQQAPDGSLLNRDKIEQYLTSNPELEVVCGGYHNLEATQKGVDKGVALHRLAEHLGLDISETMAVGDTENDLSIIRAAGIGVAMGNAIDSVKADADYITTSNMEEGIAHAFEELVFKK